MNARRYRVNLNVSPIDFPPIMGLGDSSILFRTESPDIVNNKVVLMITQQLVLLDMGNNKQHAIFTAQSVYEIPLNEIKGREDISDVYNDATLSTNEAYQYGRMQLPALPNFKFPNPPIESYQNVIDRVFDLLNSRN